MLIYFAYLTEILTHCRASTYPGQNQEDIYSRSERDPHAPSHCLGSPTSYEPFVPPLISFSLQNRLISTWFIPAVVFYLKFWLRMLDVTNKNIHETWSGHTRSATRRLDNQVTSRWEIAVQWSGLWVTVLATMAITAHNSALRRLWNTTLTNCLQGAESSWRSLLELSCSKNSMPFMEFEPFTRARHWTLSQAGLILFRSSSPLF